MADEVSTEYRVMLGVYGDLDSEPNVLMGTVEKLAGVEELVRDLVAVAQERFGVRPVSDYFWSGSTSGVAA